MLGANPCIVDSKLVDSYGCVVGTDVVVFLSLFNSAKPTVIGPGHFNRDVGGVDILVLYRPTL